MRTPILLLAGAALGIAFIFACGDGNQNHVDAAPVCDCPAAEPPLAGRIVIEPQTTSPIPAQSSASAGNACPLGATLLSGSCRIQGAGHDQITLSQSGVDVAGQTQGWDCNWYNPTTTAATGTVQVICLIPAQ